MEFLRTEHDAPLVACHVSGGFVAETLSSGVFPSSLRCSVCADCPVIRWQHCLSSSHLRKCRAAGRAAIFFAEETVRHLENVLRRAKQVLDREHEDVV